MGDFLLCRQLLHLIQQNVHLKFGAEILQPTVAEGLSVENADELLVCYFVSTS